ncbi:MAG: hypothetical protein IM558_13370 [Chitinophagaceae bacterium]|jgi:hypothetical protein|nr:hypothetical protein [Chitinophagaceae bacterium]MCA6491700.1 hypothetical protein [Chitinophagaceae bacterium]MCA6498705.1 hypothetical protein [Chitinophagaceae bacterium]MCA6512507.1 hypothetical protein [Chitinophagaceae bacterium]
MRWIYRCCWLSAVTFSPVLYASGIPAVSAPCHVHSSKATTAYFFQQKKKKPTEYSIYKRNQFLFKLSDKKFRLFRDSIAMKTKDTLFSRADGRVDIHPYQGQQMGSASEKKKSPPLVFTDKKGYVNLRLAHPKFYRYIVRFYESTGKLAFEIIAPKEDWLILEKSNFIHAGTFDYEVWQDGTLHDKGRITLQR